MMCIGNRVIVDFRLAEVYKKRGGAQDNYEEISVTYIFTTGNLYIYVYITRSILRLGRERA